MELEQRLNLVEIDIVKCQNEVKQKVSEISNKLIEQDTLRTKMNDKLDAIAVHVRKNHDLFDKHTKDEMDKYNEILESISALTTELQRVIIQTKQNTGYIVAMKQDTALDRYKEEVLKEERERLAQEEAPTKAVIEKVKMTAIGVVTTVVVGGILSILWFGFKAYVKFGLGAE